MLAEDSKEIQILQREPSWAVLPLQCDGTAISRCSLAPSGSRSGKGERIQAGTESPGTAVITWGPLLLPFLKHPWSAPPAQPLKIKGDL